MNFHPSALSPARLSVVTAPTVELWTAADAEVMSALKLDSTDDAAYLNLVLKAARKYFERITGLALITQTWKVSFDRVLSARPVSQGGSPAFADYAGHFNGREIELARAPLLAVASLQYLDEAGALQTFASTNYTVGEIGVKTAFGRLWLNDSATWPDLGSFPGALQVNFAAGFGAAAVDVPEDIRVAVLQLAAYWYENRLPVNVGNIVNQMPMMLESLIEMHRVAFIA